MLLVKVQFIRGLEDDLAARVHWDQGFGLSGEKPNRVMADSRR